MPYGVLHDQKLNSVKCENNQMIFTFDIKIFPQNLLMCDKEVVEV